MLVDYFEDAQYWKDRALKAEWILAKVRVALNEEENDEEESS